MDSDVVDWIAEHFLPFETDLRHILRRVCALASDVDDVIQETYCKVLEQGSMTHVREPRAFIVRTAKNIVLDRLRRDAVVRIESMASLDELDVADSAPSPERITVARAELNWVAGLIAQLPERCKAVFQARRVNGMSQAEAAESLGLTVGIVEQETHKGMDLISAMVARAGNGAAPAKPRAGRTRRTGGTTEC
jgi:RNA polymerase sigma-70 factor (ECF subfamily)